MNGVYLLIATFFIIAVILVTVVLVLLSKHKYKKLRQEVETLDKEKNLIASTPVLLLRMIKWKKNIRIGKSVLKSLKMKK